MIKIMLADDVKIFRDYLKSCVDWEEYGFEICCEAQDGKQALELFEEHEPDIILADITMPYIDGLELSELVLKKNPEVMVVLITGHSEFNYAIRALRMGICNYIVKPFEKEELLITLLKMKDNINKVTEMKSEKEEMAARKQEDRYRKLIYGDHKALEREIFAFPYYLVGTIVIQKDDNELLKEVGYQWDGILKQMLQGILSEEQPCVMFCDFEGNLVLALNFETEEEAEGYRSYELLDFARLVEEQLGYVLRIGLSEGYVGNGGIREAYQKTLQALSLQYEDPEEIIFDSRSMKLKKENYSWEILATVDHYLRDMRFEEIRQALEEAFQEEIFRRDYNYNTMLSMSLVSQLLAFINKKGRKAEDVFQKELRPQFILTENNSYLEKERFVLGCYGKAKAYFERHHESKDYQVAYGAKEYIDQHFPDPEFSIEDISRELLINQTYLRRMFKSEMNMTISEYLTECRVKKARELLEEGTYKVSAISDMVGYNDVSYFSKCFKKFYGISPNAVNSKK